jgi:hypothetical protein
MRYIDTGWREPSESLGHFLDSEITQGPAGLWFQSGFFAYSPLREHEATIKELLAGGSEFHVILGCNNRSLAAPDLRDLIELMGEAPTTSVTVVSFTNAFFHPKVYAFERRDSSLCAYSGSGNLTPNGLDRSVEAGLILDTHEGDPKEPIARAIESVVRWANEPASRSVRHVSTLADVNDLVEEGFIAAEAPTGWHVREGEAVDAVDSGTHVATGAGAGLAALKTRPRRRVATSRTGPIRRTTTLSGELPLFAEDAELDPMAFSVFWMEAGSMSSSGSHAQLELPRHGQRFFGFSFEDYTDDQVTIGEVKLRLVPRGELYSRPLAWHGNNRMERLNLPTRMMGGPSYENQIVVFRRGVAGEFTLEVQAPDSAEAIALRRQSDELGRTYRVGRVSNRHCGLVD